MLESDNVSIVSPKFVQGNVLLLVPITELMDPLTVPLPVILAV